MPPAEVANLFYRGGPGIVHFGIDAYTIRPCLALNYGGAKPSRAIRYNHLLRFGYLELVKGKD